MLPLSLGPVLMRTEGALDDGSNPLVAVGLGEIVSPWPMVGAVSPARRGLQG